MRSNGPEGGGQDARHKLPGIKQEEPRTGKCGVFCCAGYISPVALRLPGLPIVPRLRENLATSPHHLITFIQSHIKPRRCNHFAIIHFFTAHVLTLIAKTGVTKKNVNTITYK
ncbi:TPA: hypothetical protein MEA72_003171 [Klebsiella aerogenes]|nr:hypothetical protein [Klebsiella aerogenes]